MKAWRLASVVLLVTLALGPVLTVHAEAPRQVWVDDDYCMSCANGGHTWQVDAFATIQAAIEAVAPGGTVHVLAGRYREDVVIDRPCLIMGEGPSSVVLEPWQAAVTLLVAANDVTVQGLEVVGGTQAAILALGPDFQREAIRGVTISQNVVRGGLFGIAANIDSAWSYGQLPATGLQITGNSVSGCTRAIYVYNAQATIDGNNVSQLGPEGIGIYASQGSVAKIELNTVHVDAVSGRAIYILDNQGTLIDSNTLLGTTDVLTPTTALALYGYTDIELRNNTIRGFYWGTNAYTGGSARIVGNTFHDTVAWALDIGTAITTTQVLIEDNVIQGSYWGLRLDDDGGYGLQASITGNAFTDNAIGLQLAASLKKEQTQIHGNTICGNLVAGLRNEAASPVDATDNWWGAGDGPRPAGSGDRIEGAGGALVEPWMRLVASAQAQPDGRVVITGTLKSDPYHIGRRYLTFTTDRGTFAETGGTGRTALTDLAGEASATLSLPPGETATVTIRNGCGQGMSLIVP